MGAYFEERPLGVLGYEFRGEGLACAWGPVEQDHAAFSFGGALVAGAVGESVRPDE